ncbi:MAG TPA: hypothetical protein VHS97_06430, partial [Isosphaeraceae bacterium]|nr:hypothetical protein [Isosphaeraceae bacterium]
MDTLKLTYRRHQITYKKRRRVPFGLLGLGVLVALAMLGGRADAFMGYGPHTTFGSAGSANGQFTKPLGVAVDDASEDVYVVDEGGKRVEEFSAEGGYLAQFNGSDNPATPSGFEMPTAIAVDNSAGASKADVYVVDSARNTVDKFSSSGAFVFELGSFASKVIGVAVDNAGHLWVAEENKSVQEFDGSAKNA